MTFKSCLSDFFPPTKYREIFKSPSHLRAHEKKPDRFEQKSPFDAHRMNIRPRIYYINTRAHILQTYIKYKGQTLFDEVAVEGTFGI